MVSTSSTDSEIAPPGPVAAGNAARPRLMRRLLVLLVFLGVGGALIVGRDNVAVATGPDQIAVRAQGVSGSEQIELVVNDQTVQTWTLDDGWSVLSHQVDTPTAIRSVEVRFINDAPSRDVRVDYVDVGAIRLESEAPSTRSTGTWSSNGGCHDRSSSSEVLHCNGSFSYQVPLGTVIGRPPVGSGQELAIRALGTSGTEQLHLRVNGTVVAAFTVGTSWDTFTYALDDDELAHEVEVAFVNDAAGRDVRIDWLEVDGTRYESEASTTQMQGQWAPSRGGCYGGQSTTEWLYCSGWFRYAIGTQTGTPVLGDPPPEVVTPVVPAPVIATPAPTTPIPPRVTPPPTTSPSPTAPPPVINGRYSIDQVIDGTISAGDGSNPNEENPMGRHDAPLALPQGWSWSQGPSRNSQWGQFGTGGSRFAEFRCAVIPEQGHTPSVPFRINVRNAAYYHFANGSWSKGFDVDLTGGNHGAYLGQAGRENQNPFESSRGQIQWRREADGSFSAPWNADALMMHFWAGRRQAAVPGQTAEFITSEVRLQQPDGQTVDLSDVNVLFQCGVDYYATTGGQGTRVPGPGIAKYHFATPEWQPGLWVTLPGNAPANSTADFARWLEANTPPDVGT